MNDHGSALVAAMEVAWESIQANHPDVPDVVIRLGVGDSNWGHFAWHRLVEEGRGTAHEVMLGAQRLGMGPAEAFTTLLHEAVHAANYELGVKDVSRQGRYHNKRFAAKCDEMGLLAEFHSPTCGLALTTLAEGTAKRYADVIARLSDARKVYETPAVAPAAEGTEKKERKSAPKAVCGCGDRLIPASALRSGPLVCGICSIEFVEVEDDGN